MHSGRGVSYHLDRKKTGPFILARTDERRTKSIGRILLYALGFLVVSRIAAGALTVDLHGVLVYLRINLGFWWGVGAHVAINLFGACAMLCTLLG